MGHRPPRPRAAVATWSEPAHAPGRRLPPPAARVLARRDHPPARNPLGPARRRRGRARRARAPRAACRTASWSAPTGSPNANNCPPSSRAGPAAPWPCWPRCSRWRCSPASAWPWARWATARGPSTCCGRWAPCWPARADLPAVAGQLSPATRRRHRPGTALAVGHAQTRARAGHGAGAPGPAQPAGARRRCAGCSARSATCSG